MSPIVAINKLTKKRNDFLMRFHGLKFEIKEEILKGREKHK